MLYLQNTQEAQELFVPKNGIVPPGEVIFKAKSTIDLETMIDVEVVDLNISTIFMLLSVILPADLVVGEYEYSVQVGDQIISSGLLVIGEYDKPDQYEKPIQYEQYNAE